MNILTFKLQKEKGFRLNMTDIIFMVFLISCAVFLYSRVGTFLQLYLLPIYVGFSFFLFCNVFRLSTKFFLVIAMITFNFFFTQWVIISMVIASFIQFVLILLFIQFEDYRGVFYKE